MTRLQSVHSLRYGKKKKKKHLTSSNDYAKNNKNNAFAAKNEQACSDWAQFN